MRPAARPGQLGDPAGRPHRGRRRGSQLVASLAGARVVVASTRPVLGRHGMSVTLAGLTDAAAVDLVAHDLGRPLTAAEESAVRALAGGALLPRELIGAIGDVATIGAIWGCCSSVD